jgi:hypothetical protein
MAFTRCPDPAARRTIVATSSVDRGAARSAANQRWFPAQFDTVEAIAPSVLARPVRRIRAVAADRR